MKKVLLKIVVLMLLGDVACARNVFEVTGTEDAGEVRAKFCLTFQNEVEATCEKHVVSALNWTVRTTIPQKMYTRAAVKLFTAGYTLDFSGANCERFERGYCVFSVSDTAPKRLFVKKNVTYLVGGTVVGLTGNGLVLQNNGRDSLELAAGTSSFEFTQRLIYGAPYDVTILEQPVGQRCTVTRGSGGKITGNVKNISINCVDLGLYASTGAGSPTNPNSLYRMETTGPDVGLGTFVMGMTDNDGAVIASNGEYIWHWTGYFPLRTFERVDVTDKTLMSIPFSGAFISEVFGAVFYEESFLVSSIDGDFLTFSPVGLVTRIGTEIGARRGGACYNKRMYAVSPDSDRLYELSLVDGQTLSSKPITLEGFKVSRGLGITVNPNTGELYALLKLAGDPQRKLVTIDRETGVATLLADARGEEGNEKFSSLAFHPANPAC